MRGTPTDTGGVCLVEVVLAVLLVGLGLLAVAGMTTQAVRTLGRARSIQQATVAVAELADSIALAGSGGGGAWAKTWGSVDWSESRTGALATVRLVAHGIDPARPPLVDVVAIVPANE